MNFRKKEKTGKKSGKFSPGRKNGRKEGERENFRKIKIFSKKRTEKRFLEKERKRQEKQDIFRKKGKKRKDGKGRTGWGKNGRNFLNFQESPKNKQDF